MIEANRNIIGKLLSISAKEEQRIDVEKALRYPLYSVPLCLANLPDIYKEFILKFLQTIPKRFCRVDILADCYRDNSIKSSERMKKEESSKIRIGSVMSRLPRDMNKFLMNNDNKNTLIKLIFEYIIDKKTLCFANLTN